ncbi:N-formylglutamate deformylase [Pseudovibrio sp. Tun.PSC04-5.I4]|uniref:N-formylglutamate deformylase n=1 Tax=Pseudovibrio sp. Tun.PSC04-5.I4 TaxID=1798213 RepID=UPI00088B6BF6|nr:N-formylglutamate deformylase [Pseudovibrio sp. Tun.PSC04-5.I4]SDR20647.1 formiminoglutamase [Pseudovibrio sp. Tun.PSC04-5.I4]
MTYSFSPLIKRGDSPIVLAQPHGGTDVPLTVWGKFNDVGQSLADTDWHINRLYDGLLETASVIQTPMHRYVIDANRDPAGVSLYPGQNTTTLCPLTDFDGRPIYRDGQEPSEDEVEARRAEFHAPYHEAIAEELERVRQKFGVAVLYDCHSIRSNIPFLFEGALPVFNIGTNGGLTCALQIEAITVDSCRQDESVETVVNARFKGGWTTRRYGQPESGIHAIQMETAQRAYMFEQSPWTYAPERANKTRAVLKTILSKLEAQALSGEFASATTRR